MGTERDSTTQQKINSWDESTPPKGTSSGGRESKDTTEKKTDSFPTQSKTANTCPVINQSTKDTNESSSGCESSDSSKNIKPDLVSKQREKEPDKNSSGTESEDRICSIS